MIIDEEPYLEHFGVKGMKWGQRKTRETGNSQKRTTGDTQSSEPQKKGLSSNQKKALAGGAAAGAVVAALIAKHANTKVKDMKIQNYSKTVMDIHMNRTKKMTDISTAVWVKKSVTKDQGDRLGKLAYKQAASAERRAAVKAGLAKASVPGKKGSAGMRFFGLQDA